MYCRSIISYQIKGSSCELYHDSSGATVTCTVSTVRHRCLLPSFCFWPHGHTSMQQYTCTFSHSQSCCMEHEDAQLASFLLIYQTRDSSDLPQLTEKTADAHCLPPLRHVKPAVGASRHPDCPPAHTHSSSETLPHIAHPLCIETRSRHCHPPSCGCDSGTTTERLVWSPWLPSRLSTSTHARSCTIPSHRRLSTLGSFTRVQSL